jgi:hypothetical protein
LKYQPRRRLKTADHPLTYLHYVLKHIASADTVEKLEALLPWNINKAVLTA